MMTEYSDLFKAGALAYGMTDLLVDRAMDEKRYGPMYDIEMGPISIVDKDGKTIVTDDLYKDRSPINKLHRLKGPLLILQGAKDLNVLQKQSDLAVEKLKNLGKSDLVDYVVYPEERHGFLGDGFGTKETKLDALSRLVSFFKKNLPKKSKS